MTDDAAPATDRAPKRGGKVAKLIILALLLAAFVAALVYPPVRAWMQASLDWVKDLGVWAPVFVAGFYIVACVLFLPGSVITVGAGAVLGVPMGTIAVSIGSTLGAAAAFCVGRFIARDWVAAKVADHPRFAAIDEAVGREGFKIVLLTRLSPIFPFNLLNFAYGLTKVRLGTYVLASWIGMFPATVMYVYLGSLGKVATQWSQMPTMQKVLYLAGLVATVAVTVVITRLARRALKEAVNNSRQPPSAEGAGHGSSTEA